jgi:hypothetical protein
MQTLCPLIGLFKPIWIRQSLQLWNPWQTQDDVEEQILDGYSLVLDNIDVAYSSYSQIDILKMEQAF